MLADYQIVFGMKATEQNTDKPLLQAHFLCGAEFLILALSPLGIEVGRRVW
jgi:hypothetical protein